MDVPEGAARHTDKPLVFILDHVLSPTECEQMIAWTEGQGYIEALVNVGGGQQKMIKDVRNNDRCIIDDAKIAVQLWDRIKPFIPQQIGDMKAVGLNERLRFLRYDPGQEFKPHMDGTYAREDGSGERSLITVQFYLNEGFEGGATTFIGHHQEQLDCVPKIGRVLVFEHRVRHAGTPLIKGRKYTLRTDVMYKKEAEA